MSSGSSSSSREVIRSALLSFTQAMGSAEGTKDVKADNEWKEKLGAVFDDIFNGSNIKDDFEAMLDLLLRTYLTSYITKRVGNGMDIDGWIEMALGHHKQFKYDTTLPDYYGEASKSQNFNVDEWNARISYHRSSIKRRLKAFKNKISVTWLLLFSFFISINLIAFRTLGRFIR